MCPICMQKCLQMDADERPTCSQLLRHAYFQLNSFSQVFSQQLKLLLLKEAKSNPLLAARSNISARASGIGYSVESNLSAENRQRRQLPTEPKNIKNFRNQLANISLMETLNAGSAPSSSHSTFSMPPLQAIKDVK
jgi:serine/threonine protein kinase